MSGFLAVLQREVAERRLLLPGALALGLFPLAAPYLQGGVPAAEARGGAALALAGITAAVLGLLLGGSVLARDLAERRLGFYFSRPLSGWAIWGGKLAAAVALTFAAAALVLLPALLLGLRPAGGAARAFGSAGADFAAALPPAALALAALVLAAGAGSVMVRSRSPWLPLDLAALAAVAAVAAVAARRLALAWAFGALEAGLRSLAPAAVLALLAASAAQVLGGRTDPRRAHRFLSLTLWGGLLAAALAFAGYARWVLAAAPRDLERIEVLQPAPAGGWVALGGTVAHRSGYSPAFLLDSGSGRFARAGSTAGYGWSLPVFSDDGRRAALVMPRERGRGYELAAFDLGERGARPARSLAGFESYPEEVVLSPDGRRVAAFVRDRLVVQEVATGRLLAVVPSPAAEAWQSRRLRFLAEGRLRIFAQLYRGGHWQIEVSDLDPGTGRLAPAARIPGSRRAVLWQPSPDAERIVAREPDRGGRRLYDAETGAALAELAPPGTITGAGFLADGRVAVDGPMAGGRELALFDRDGASLGRFAFPGAVDLKIAGAPRPGMLVVAVRPSGAPAAPAGWRCSLLDLASGSRREIGRGLAPAGSVAATGRVFLEREGGGLVAVEPNGELRTVLPGRGKTRS